MKAKSPVPGGIGLAVCRARSVWSSALGLRLRSPGTLSECVHLLVEGLEWVQDLLLDYLPLLPDRQPSCCRLHIPELVELQAFRLAALTFPPRQQITTRISEGNQMGQSRWTGPAWWREGSAVLVAALHSYR